MSATFTELSIVCVTYESARVIGGWLDGVHSLLPGAQIVVVDNASGDETLRIVGKRAPDAVVIESGGNVGFARGCNAGARAASGPFVMFLNPDARIAAVDPDLLIRELGQGQTGILVPLMRSDRGSTSYEIFSDRSAAGEWFVHVMGPLWPRVGPKPPWAIRHGSRWASGAALIVSAEEFKKLGGFDESFFLLYEDRELSARYRAAGYSLRESRAVTITHDIGTSSSAEGLDVRRRCWAALSWVELRCATAGEPAGRTTAKRIRAGLRIQAGIAGGLARLGASRTLLGRKLCEAGEVEQCMCEAGGLAEAGFYRRARAAVKPTRAEVSDHG